MSQTGYGRGSTFIVLELKDLLSGAKLQERLRSAESVERVPLEERRVQYLYKAAGAVVCMDNDSFDQLEVPESLFGDSAPFLAEGMEVTLSVVNDKVLLARLPAAAVYTVADTDTVRKSTAVPQYKVAVLENGVQVDVPPFIAKGEKIRVSIPHGEYLERA
eukprot:CAMPEP_0196660616 /NCGR_PEP_ID=MMETSP1086-20130531/40653_1 /TAXON_ID=77921 /ORGANISM="Cyanoptyche  gloeocystis , Strain SAG4.97" /LENGTH=160 /DNA_ID=CAMNT_0041995121 /DNA_START=192 /DNA_END=674 /DNA_ORIENTATION=-